MRFVPFAVVSVLLLACGGSSGGPLGDAGNGADAPTPGNDAGPVVDSGKPDAPIVGDSSAACPDESGTYSIQLSGQGCGDTSTNVKECIQQTDCTIDLSFGLGTTTAKGLAGKTSIESDGSFSGAAIDEGSSKRTGCTGTWDAQTSTLVVDCGGMNTSQSCVATLTRTGNTCE